ncbi:MAG TPA: hypothetical protein VF103_18145, partial [Polyangiaceae bacterium]
MDDAIRRKALRSAAKVAFGATLCWGVTLSGCGGKSVGDGSDVAVLATDPSFVNCCRYVNAHYAFTDERH